MEVIITWFQQYWYVVVLVAGVLIKIINLTTNHFSEHKGVVKWMLFIVDILDMVKSTPVPRRKYSLKLKGTINTIIVGLLVTLCAGCVTTNGQRKFDPTRAMAIACASVPVVDAVHTLVCESLPPEKRAKCYEAKAKAKIAQDVILTVGEAVLNSCSIPEKTNEQ